MIKFLKDQLSKLQDYYHLGSNSSISSSLNTSTSSSSSSASGATLNGPSNSSSNIGSCGNNSTTMNGTTASSNQGATANGISNAQPATPNSVSNNNVTANATPAMSDEHKLAFKQWHYCAQLTKYMFEEGLLDRQELLQWILELLDKMRSAPSDDGILKLLLPLALQYLEEFVQSELLARKLAYLCCKKIAHMCNNIDTSCCPQSPSIAVIAAAAAVKSEINGNKDGIPMMAPVVNQLNAVFNDYLNCPHHRDVLYGLSTIIQVRFKFFIRV